MSNSEKSRLWDLLDSDNLILFFMDRANLWKLFYDEIGKLKDLVESKEVEMQNLETKNKVTFI